MKVLFKRSGLTAKRLIGELQEELARGKVTGLARLPEPRVGIKYRDVVQRIFTLTGTVQPVVLVELEGGHRKVYSFVVESEPGKGADFLSSPVLVSGRLINYRDTGAEVTDYRRYRYGSAQEGFAEVNRIADLYESAYDVAFERRISSIDPYFWIK